MNKITEMNNPVSNTMVKIAFGFQAQVGKDTAIDYLINEWGGTRLAFAWPLKDIRDFAQRRVGFSAMKDRKLLQCLGDWVRKDDPLKLLSLLITSIPESGHVFVSDVRYPNEFDALKKAGFSMVKITRQNARASNDSSVCAHSSEQSLCDAQWDFVLHNDSVSLSSFHRVVHDLFLVVNAR